jgi:hypothetical protein
VTATVRVPRDRRLRAGLIVVTVVQGALGGWQLLFPRSFYDNMPLPGHPWVALLPPYNMHLIVDLGAANIAMAVLLGSAAISMQRALVKPAVLTGVVFAAPHFIFHAMHLAAFPVVEAVAQTIALGGWLALMVSLLVLAVRRPEESIAVNHE